jgi:hypothetical protein
MLGKVGISAAYGIIYVWSAELYPTVVRNAGVGISSTFANLGAMIASYIADIVRQLQSYFLYHLGLWCFNVTFNNISDKSWRSVLVHEIGVTKKNHRHAGSH